MKAAVINKLGDIPRYEDFPDPVLNDGDVTVKVKAVILDYANKVLASGTHFASKQYFPSLPAIVGYSGIGSLEDGITCEFYRYEASIWFDGRKGSGTKGLRHSNS